MQLITNPRQIRNRFTDLRMAGTLQMPAACVKDAGRCALLTRLALKHGALLPHTALMEAMVLTLVPGAWRDRLGVLLALCTCAPWPASTASSSSGVRGTRLHCVLDTLATLSSPLQASAVRGRDSSTAEIYSLATCSEST